MDTSPSRPVSRRRQRSVRVTVAVVLLSVATLGVLAALPTQSAMWLSAAAVLALACGWAAARIVYTELAQSRREAARDRAAQAKAYRSMFSERASEHAEFTSVMTDRLARSEKDRRELEGTVVLAEKRAIEAETRVQREARRANQAEEKVAELAAELEAAQVRRTDLVDDLAVWDELDDRAHTGWPADPDLDTVVDLMAWEEKTAAQEPATPQQRHA